MCNFLLNSVSINNLVFSSIEPVSFYLFFLNLKSYNVPIAVYPQGVQNLNNPWSNCLVFEKELKEVDLSR